MIVTIYSGIRITHDPVGSGQTWRVILFEELFEVIFKGNFSVTSYLNTTSNVFALLLLHQRTRFGVFFILECYIIFANWSIKLKIHVSRFCPQSCVVDQRDELQRAKSSNIASVICDETFIYANGSCENIRCTSYTTCTSVHQNFKFDFNLKSIFT